MPVRIHNLLLDVTLGGSETSGSPSTSSAQLKPQGSGSPVAKALPKNVAERGGRPLPGTVRQTMESALGADFSNVRIHEDSQPARQLNALAFTQGSHVHFAPGQFKPNTPSGLSLIGHELAHVVQQRSGRVKPTTQFAGGPLDVFERQANAVERMFSGGAVTGSLAGSVSDRTMGLNSLSSTIHRKAAAGGMIRRSGGAFKKLLGGSAFTASAEGKGSLSINRLMIVWPEASRRSGVVNRKRSAMELARIQGAGGRSGPVPAGFEAGIEGSSGLPLADDVRSEMEALLGVDLKDVRVHLDTPAQEAARLINAEAFTLGQDIFFAQNQFSPNTADGMGLLAHELTHVAQGMGAAPTLGPGGGSLGASPDLGGGFMVAGHDGLERQAEFNEQFVARSFRGGGGSTSAMAIPLASDLIQPMGGRGMFAMSAAPGESTTLQPIDDGPVKEALGMLRSAGRVLGTAADIAIGFVPVVGDLYDLMCGILGRAIFTWESLDVWERLLCFVGVIPIPFVSGALLRRGKRALSWLLSESRALRILNTVTQKGIEFLRRNLGRLREWIARIGGTVRDGASRAVEGIQAGTTRTIEGARSFARGVRQRVGKMFKREKKPPPIKPRQAQDLFEQMFEPKLQKLAARAGKDPQELLEAAAKAARKDMEQVMKEGMDGMMFRADRTKGALKKQDIEVLDWKIKEYNDRVVGGAKREDAGLIDYGKVPAKAGGAAAIAGKDSVYLLSGNPITNFVLAIFKGNIPKMHEMGHVLQYAYFHRMIKHLGVPMSQKDLKVLQIYLETRQKSAMEGMAYLFGIPMPFFGQAFRRKMFRNFMDVTEKNLLSRKYDRWKTHMTTGAAVYQGALMGAMAGPIGGVWQGLGAAGVIGALTRLGPLRKALPGAPDLDDLRAELARERDPQRVRILKQAIDQMQRPGLPLEFSVRNRLEAYLGQPLDDVRLHDGMLAERLARNLGAEAVTLGGQVVMGAGSYQPDTPEGLGLLAHEATHVVQERQGRTIEMSAAQHDRLEAEAHGIERAVVRRAQAAPLPRFRAPVEPEYRREPVHAERIEAPAPAPVKKAVPESLSRSLAKAVDERPEMAQADQVERAMAVYAGRGTSREEFMSELRERVMDLLQEEMDLAAERGAIG